MSGTLTYRRSGYPPVYSVYIEIELPQTQEPKVHITRYREESYVSGGGCGSCGYQRPIQVYRNDVSRTQHIAGNQVQIGRWVYQFNDIRLDDQVRVERYEANALQESITYTATNTGFALTTPYNSQVYDDSLHIALVDGDQPVRTLHGQYWWHQPVGVLRVRNGFAMQGILAVPVPQIDTAKQSLLQSMISGQAVKEPACLN